MISWYQNPFLFSLAPAAIFTPSVSPVFRLAVTRDSNPGIPNCGLYNNSEILGLLHVISRKGNPRIPTFLPIPKSRDWQTGPGLQSLAMTDFKIKWLCSSLELKCIGRFLFIMCIPVMLVLGLGLKAKKLGLGLETLSPWPCVFWPWPWCHWPC